MPRIQALQQYLHKHPRYVFTFIKEICQIWWWRLCGQPIVVLTTESGGLGDYYWIRNYYYAIREHYAPKQCRIVVIGMFQWYPVVYNLDADVKRNHFDIFRFFESPDNPLRIESLFFKLFRADVYVDFRTRHLKQLVKAKVCYFGEGSFVSKQYYENANNLLISQWFPLPSGFKHLPPLLPIVDVNRQMALESPYVFVAEKGNTQGTLSDEQLISIVTQIHSQGYNIFFNGDCSHLSVLLKQCGNEGITNTIIDGYTYPLTEYPAVIAQCRYIVTVNTLPYHIAIQLEKPCVVLSANEYETVKLDNPNQIILFNKELQRAFESHTLQSYQSIPSVGLKDIECERIENAIHDISLDL